MSLSRGYLLNLALLVVLGKPMEALSFMAVLEGRDIFAQDFIQQEIFIAENEELSDIQRFYEDSSILITGGTGFVGKVLTEKILRGCPKFKKLYLMIRPKKGKEIKERYADMFDGPVFERIKAARPDFQDKIVVVHGDCVMENLGLSEEDKQMLISDVSIIFHCAATVRFDEVIRTAVNINVRGTKILLEMARKMRNLKAFVHMSTAYSNCPKKEIHEKFYDPPVDYNKIMTLVDILDNEPLSVLTPTLIGNWPNTYTYTKVIAEDVIKTYGQGLPIAVIRPSIVISTSKEPIAGWINNFYGPQGVVFGAALGLLRTLHCGGDVLADMVPVDFVVNATLALAWDVGRTRGDNPNFEKIYSQETQDYVSTEEKTDSDIPVLNYVSSEVKPITWEKFMYLNYLYGNDIPTTLQLWYSSLTLNSNYYIDLFYRFFLHWIPALLVDSILYSRGKKPMMWNAYKKVHKFSSVISYFSTTNWKFRDDNVWKLWKKLSDKDKEIFDFNLHTLDWEQYFYTYIRGLRLYMGKEDLSTLPEGKKLQRKLTIAHFTLLTIMYSLLAYFLWSMYNRIFN